MALTTEDLQAIKGLLANTATKDDISSINSRLDALEQSHEVMKNSILRMELEQYPRIQAALDGVLSALETTAKKHDVRITKLEFALQS